MTTLTDRYVHAVTRLLPADQRSEVDRELRVMIDDLIAAYDHEGADPTVSVEYAVLKELGDPNLLAASYVDSPRSLIGKEVFPEYTRSLKIVMMIAVPALVGLTLLGVIIGGDVSAGRLIGSPLSAAYQAVVQVAFWVTLVYAFADRWKDRAAWTPRDLPEVESYTGFDSSGRVQPQPSASSQIFSIVFTILVAVLLVWQHFWPFVHDDGVGVPALDPSIWKGAAQLLLATFAASVVIQLIALLGKRWNYGLAMATLINSAVSFGIVGWLAIEERFINPDLLSVIAERANWGQVPTVNPFIIIAIAAAIEVWDVAESFTHAYRNSQQQVDAPSDVHSPVS